MKTPKRIGQSVVTGIGGTLRGVPDTSLLTLVEANTKGVLVTLKGDGRPQLSNIMYGYDDGVVRISVTDGRAKTRNLRRDPRASLYVTRDDFWAYAVAEGTATLTPVATDPHDDTVEELVELYRRLQGEHPDWDEYRAAMVADRRLVVRLPVERVYGMA
jgi:PPOX class probable F420-dependent enzyme